MIEHIGKCTTGKELLNLLQQISDERLMLKITLNSGYQGCDSGDLQSIGYEPTIGFSQEHLVLWGD